MIRSKEIKIKSPLTGIIMKFDEKVAILEQINAIKSNDAEKYLCDTSTYPNRFFNFDMNLDEINSEYERLKPITRNKFELNKQYELFIKINEMDEDGLIVMVDIKSIDEYEGQYDKRTIEFIKMNIVPEDFPTDEEIDRTSKYLDNEKLCKEIYELGCKFANEEMVSMITGIGSMANLFN